MLCAMNCIIQETLPNGMVNPQCRFITCFTHESLRYEREKFAGERPSLAKSDTRHLTWRLSDNIVIVLCFDCHGRVLRKML